MLETPLLYEFRIHHLVHFCSISQALSDQVVGQASASESQEPGILILVFIPPVLMNIVSTSVGWSSVFSCIVLIVVGLRREVADLLIHVRRRLQLRVAEVPNLVHVCAVLGEECLVDAGAHAPLLGYRVHLQAVFAVQGLGHIARMV